MNCASCSSEIAAVTEIFFLVKSQKEIHLALRPELRDIVKSRSLKPTQIGKDTKLVCKNCDHEVGKLFPIGPGGVPGVAFGNEKVKLLGRQLSKKEKWRQVLDTSPFDVIEKRDLNEFFGKSKEDKLCQDDSKVALEETEPNNESVPRELTFASKFEHYRWDDILRDKKARTYQIKSFVQSLHSNLIVALPTGSGKTLIAAMLMCRMRELNPGHLSAMVVNKIPLVFQQAEAIRSDTGLICMPLCSENKTQSAIRSLNDGTYNCLVATAGLLAELFRQNEIEKSLFSCIVFDECHHARGANVYCELLDMFNSLPVKPRLLGLSASPFRSESIEKGRDAMKEIRAKFQNALVYRPIELSSSEQDEHWVIVAEDSRFEQFSDLMLDVIRILRAKLQMLVGSNDLTKRDRTDFLQRKFVPSIRGQLKGLTVYHGGDREAKKVIRRIAAVYESIFTARNIDVTVSATQLSLDLPDLSPTLREFMDERRSSDRVNKLFSELRNASESSRMIVFVDTRAEARIVCNKLEERFSDMNPLKLVGHGGYDGMGWEDEQEDVISKFNSGQSRLIVCTSVLEEGLDVEACDLVIRFCGVRSLIQFVQSRGRARKKGSSRFVVLLSEDEKKFMFGVRDEEKIMESILKSESVYNKVPTLEVERIISHLESRKDVQENELAMIEKLKIPQTEVSGMATLELYLSGVLDNSTGSQHDDIQNFINNEIRNCNIFKPKRIVMEHKEPSESLPVFFDIHTTAYVYLSKRQKYGKVAENYKDFCRVWKFFIRLSAENRTLNVFSRLLLENKQLENFPNKAEYHVKVSQINFGHFLNGYQFLIVCGASFSGDLSLDSSYIPDLILNLVDQMEMCRIKPEVYGRFLIRNYSTDNTVQFFMFTNSVPQTFSVVTEVYCRTATTYFLQNVAENPVLRFTMDKNEADKFAKLCSKYKNFIIPIFDSHIETVVKDTLMPDNTAHNMPMENEEFDMWWNFLVLRSARKHWLSPSAIEDLNAEVNIVIDLSFEAKSLILKLICGKVLQSQTPVDILTKWEYYMSIPADVLQLSESRNPVPGDCTLVKRVVLTPNRVIYRLPFVSANNRLLRLWKRKWPEIDIISVVFADEQMQSLTDACTFKFVQQTMKSGLVIKGRQYDYLCASGSQLRSQRAYFVYPSKAVSMVRNYIISNGEDLNIAKYTARLGLFCSADKEIRTVRDSEFQVIPDIKTLSGTVVTDGSGFISKELAQEISKSHLDFDTDHVPAAFQVRFAGMKGVLAVDFAEKCNEFKIGSYLKVLFRDSMNKFETPDRMLTVGSYSKFLPFNLNREFITLMDALKPVGDYKFRAFLLRCQAKALESSTERFKSTIAAIDALSQFMKKSDIELVTKSGVNILEEPLWISMLRATYKIHTRLVKTKTRIELENAALLIGIPDPLGVLRDNEVFVCLSADRGTQKQGVIFGDVLIFRNPGLHPGDIRKVSAVNKPELKLWKDVIVMPAALATFSLSAQCSGGDLDGDKFPVIWEPELVSLIRSSHEPLDYDNLQVNNPQPSASIQAEDDDSDDDDYDDIYSYDNYSDDDCYDDDNIPQKSTKEMAKFFKRVLSNDALGRVANMHLALCDLKPKGACDKLAIELAKSQSLAVDFPKTGILPLVPREARESVTEFPDFMGKALNVSYASQKVLGELYRRCIGTAYDPKITELKLKPPSNLDNDLLVDGYQLYAEEAESVYRSYKLFLREILVAYSLRSEAELMIGRAVTWSEAMNVDGDLSAKTIQAAKSGLYERFRDVFYRHMTKAKSEDVKRKASAWYYVAYSDSKSKPCLSFPWLVLRDVLSSIKKEANEINPVSSSAGTKVDTKYGVSAQKLFMQFKDNLLDDQKEKLSVVKLIEKCLGESKVDDRFQVSPYGSVPLCVHANYSDVDVCLRRASSQMKLKSDEDKCSQCSMLERVLPFLQSIELEPCEFVKSAKTPIIKLSIRTGDSVTDCDISADDASFRKTSLIQNIFSKDAGFFLAFWLLVRWARASEIIKQKANDDNNFMASAEFYLLILMHSFQNYPEELENSFQISEVVEKIHSNTKEVLNSAHKFIFEFLDKIGEKSEEFKLQWPINGSYWVEYSEEQVKLLAQKALAAKHCLAVTGDANVLIQSSLAKNNSTECLFKKRLPRLLAVKIADTLDFHALTMSARTGANVRFVEDSRHVIFVEASGNAIALQRFQDDFLRLKRSQALHGFIPFKVDRYFIEGSTLLLVQQAPAHTSRVSFKPSCGPYQMYHEVHERSLPILSSNRIPLHEWKKNAIEALAQHCCQQLKAFPYDNPEALETLEIGLGFGCFYTVNTSFVLPPTQQTLALDELKASIEKARRNRKKIDRIDFKRHWQPKKDCLPISSKSDQKRFEMTTLGPSNTRLMGIGSEMKFDERAEKRKQQKRLYKKGLANSFGTGMFVNNFADARNVQQAFEIYQTTLSNTGYTPLERKKHYAKITIVPSTSYTANITLSENLEVLVVEERMLNWVHVTILDGNNENLKPGQQFIRNHDLRLRVQSTKRIKRGTELFDYLFPTGELISPVIVTRKDPNSVQVADHFKQERIDERISHVRVIDNHFYMKKDISANKNSVVKTIIGEVSCGIEHGGNNFEMKRKFCELYLQFDVDYLKGIMKNEKRRLNKTEIYRLSDILIQESLLVSQTLRNLMK